MSEIQTKHGRVIETFSLLVPDNDVVSFSFSFDNEIYNFEILFIPDDSPDGLSQLNWTINNNVIRFTFTGWKNALPSTTVEPIVFLGQTKDKSNLSFSLMHLKAGKLNKLDFQFIVCNPGDPIRVVTR